MSRITPCLWYDGQAEEAADFYVSLLPDSRIDRVMRSPADNPSTPEGAVLTVEFTLAGQSYFALNGGPLFHFTEAVSFMIACDDQAEVDRLWDALTADGGQEVQCGWLKDRYGLSWQVVPAAWAELVTGSDPRKVDAAVRAMLGMKKLDLAALQRAYDEA